ncbi:hypothetical protein P171DRAFT_469220 [Karstenula rhodostoma CBS 690.94]|uniref:Uncharacterized protein n=1 Tax=Karstenula rhodostoma CBS 690.94 TaxID=1392251 RepID=A0A9P4UHY0_9PLEO|nr:hypothetical protein P171DRAFT_469220 [Karstenula rhodostoma CBS 690.94]
MATHVRVALSSVDDPERTILIWRDIPYESLKEEAYRSFHHSPDIHDVHFHTARKDFENCRCQYELSPSFWKVHEYTTGEVNENGELLVWAHFMPKPQQRESPYNDVASVAESEDVMQAAHRGENLDRLFTNRGHPYVRRSARPRGKKTAYRRRRQAISRGESQDTVIEEEDVVIGPPDKAVPKFDARVHSALPIDATVEKYTIDFEEACNDNTEDQFNTTKTHITQKSKEARRQIASARLIYGTYGVTASTPCDHCAREGKSCRLYHPLLYTETWHDVNKQWQVNKYGRRACALCVGRANIRQSCNAQYARYTQ